MEIFACWVSALYCVYLLIETTTEELMLNQTWNDGESNEQATGKAIWKLVYTGCLQRVLFIWHGTYAGGPYRDVYDGYYEDM